MVLVLLLTGWEDGVTAFNQSESMVKQNQSNDKELLTLN